jgi:hypothetical protein
MEAEGIEYSAARIGSQVWTTENMRHVSCKNSIYVTYYSYPNTSLISSNPELLGYASLMHKFLVHLL